MGTLRYVTLTGVDEKTSFARMARISATSPLVEWGVLYSPDNAGKKPRYPRLEWLENFAAKAKKRRMNTALHLCGQAVSSLLACVDQRPDDRAPEAKRLLALASHFGRVQLNVRAKMANLPGYGQLVNLLHRNEMRTKVILQWNDHNQEVCQRLRGTYGFEVLVDYPGGRGKQPASWPLLSPMDASRPGYAGGLSPDNLAAQLPVISKAAGGRIFWVDAESRLRDDNDCFELDNCEQMLSVATEFIAAQRREQGALWGKGWRTVDSLKGLWLDWWVARAYLRSTVLVIPPLDACAVMKLDRHGGEFNRFAPSENDSVAMKVLSDENIALEPSGEGRWQAYAKPVPGTESLTTGVDSQMSGPDLTTAGLRAVVAKHFGTRVPKDPATWLVE